MNTLIDRGDERVADLFRSVKRVEKLLAGLEGPTRRTLNGQRFITVSEILRVSRRTLQEYRSAGIIPYYLICGKVIYSESEIAQFLEKSRRRSIEEMEVL